MAASSKTEIDDLSQLTVDQLLQEIGLPTTGKKKVLIERLVDDSKSNVVKPESKEEMNLAESAESSSEVEIQEINSIRRKAKALQIHMDALIREISELSQSTSNKVKVKVRIERITCMSSAEK